MLRFVVLHHTGWAGHADHFDLMLQKEEGSSADSLVLATYSTAADEFPAGSGELLFPNHDHRRAYLAFEGPLAQQRGTVQRADAGGLEWLGGNRFRLDGPRLAGDFHLEPQPGNVVKFVR